MMKSPRPLCVLMLVLVLVTLLLPEGARAAGPFADPAFATRWQGDEATTPNFWGPPVIGGAGEYEQYDNTPPCPETQPAVTRPCNLSPARRLVQYFDKGRMELGADGATVTSGLLVREMIAGQIQVGDTQFLPRSPAAISVAGDPDNTFPLYRDLTNAALPPAPPVGAPVRSVLNPDGSTASTAAGVADANAAIATTDTATGNALPRIFADFRAAVGVDVIGYAISAPFYATVRVRGVPRLILIQAFERRVLTYNAANPPRFQVEFGNVGQHYRRWRYGDAPPAGRTVTLADDGRTISLHPGESFLLNLGAGYYWQIAIGDPAVLGLPASSAVGTGAQGVFVANQPGQTTLTAIGDPLCRATQPQCGQPSRAFRIQVIVA